MHTRTMAAIGIALAAVAFAAPASAQGRPDDAGGGGGRPPGVGDEAGLNNLSVPAVFVNGTALAAAPALSLGCGTAVEPGHDGQPSDDVFDGYWLQKSDSTWSATCATADTATVAIDWGDNLTGTTALKAGKTIRVEAGLLAAADPTATGYLVEKLTDELDRNATYGTDGTTLAQAVAANVVEPAMAMTRVWDPEAYLTIERATADGTPVGAAIYSGAAVAEINSMGAVVYGFNWGQKGAAPLPGTYLITFHVSEGTTISSVLDENGITALPDAHTATLQLTLSAAGGKNKR